MVLFLNRSRAKDSDQIPVALLNMDWEKNRQNSLFWKDQAHRSLL